LHKRFNEFLSYLSLNFSCCVVNSEIIHIIFPNSKRIKPFKNLESYLIFLNKHFAKGSFINLNPKVSIIFFLVILLQKLIKVLKTQFSNFLHCVWNKMNEMFAPQQRTVFLSWFLCKKFLNDFKMLQYIRNTQFLNSLCEAIFII